jgi:hypothetical protein
MTENLGQFRCAALILVGPGPVKQRLCDAYLRHLREVDANDLPRDVQPDYAALVQALNSGQATGGLGVVEVAIRKMSEQEAGRHAARVLEMFVAVSGGDIREPTTTSARQLRVVGDDDEIPSFLSRA